MSASQSRKNQQFAILGISAAVIGGICYIVFGVLAPSNQANALFANPPSEIDISIISDRTSSAGPEMSWVTDSKIKIDGMSDQLASLQETLKTDRAAYAADIAKMREEFEEIILQQVTQIDGLQSRLSEAPLPVVDQQVQPASAVPGWLPDLGTTGSEFIRRNQSEPTDVTPSRPRTASSEEPSGGGNSDAGGDTLRPPSSFGQSFSLASLPEDPDGASMVNHLRNYVPAGSYAPALVLSGADAATNVTDRENPTPVLFRVTGPAVTAARGKTGARINITGCTVQGSATGDLSSERVKVRLISMTCLKRDGSVIESNVTGYMTGSGKSGVRGVVVSREGGLVTNAAIAGVLEGLASAAQAQTQTDAESVAQIAQSALSAAGAGGVQQAASTLSEYYISRAEQYQPVISLNPGTVVDLVFLEGVSLQ